MLPKDLINKYRDWKESSFAQEKDHFERLAKEGQSPKYMIISVSYTHLRAHETR